MGEETTEGLGKASRWEKPKGLTETLPPDDRRINRAEPYVEPGHEDKLAEARQGIENAGVIGQATANLEYAQQLDDKTRARKSRQRDENRTQGKLVTRLERAGLALAIALGIGGGLAARAAEKASVDTDKKIPDRTAPQNPGVESYEGTDPEASVEEQIEDVVDSMEKQKEAAEAEKALRGAVYTDPETLNDKE